MKNIPYWVAHSGVALLLSIPFVWSNWDIGLWFGIAFYLGREIRDWEKLHNWKVEGFDWKGLLAPLITNGILLTF